MADPGFRYHRTTPPLKPNASIPASDSMLRFHCNSINPTLRPSAHICPLSSPHIHVPLLTPTLLRAHPPVSEEEDLSLPPRPALGLLPAKADISPCPFPLHDLFHLHLNPGEHAIHLLKTLSAPPLHPINSPSRSHKIRSLLKYHFLREAFPASPQSPAPPRLYAPPTLLVLSRTHVHIQLYSSQRLSCLLLDTPVKTEMS